MPDDAATIRDTEREVRALLAQHGRLALDPADLAADADLYAAGLSSLASVNLMLALEERFDIEFPEHLLRRQTFASVGAIRDAVQSLTADG